MNTEELSNSNAVKSKPEYVSTTSSYSIDSETEVVRLPTTESTSGKLIGMNYFINSVATLNLHLSLNMCDYKFYLAFFLCYKKR